MVVLMLATTLRQSSPAPFCFWHRLAVIRAQPFRHEWMVANHPFRIELLRRVKSSPTAADSGSKEKRGDQPCEAGHRCARWFVLHRAVRNSLDIARRDLGLGLSFCCHHGLGDVVRHRRDLHRLLDRETHRVGLGQPRASPQDLGHNR
jgi:hypothetical protein